MGNYRAAENTSKFKTKQNKKLATLCPRLGCTFIYQCKEKTKQKKTTPPLHCLIYNNSMGNNIPLIQLRVTLGEYLRPQRVCIRAWYTLIQRGKQQLIHI